MWGGLLQALLLELPLPFVHFFNQLLLRTDRSVRSARIWLGLGRRDRRLLKGWFLRLFFDGIIFFAGRSRVRIAV